MIAVCRECRAPYWRYSRSQPPRGFCQQLCHDIRQAAVQGLRSIGPGIPIEIIQVMRSHRRIVHHTADETLWFDNCAECLRLEDLYAASLAYHMPAEWTAEQERKQEPKP